MPVTVTGTLEDAVRTWATEKGQRCVDGFTDELKNNASRRTGEMVDSIEAEEAHIEGDSVVSHIEVGAEHGIYQDQGTGIYGPEGQEITPIHGKVLRFDSPILGIVFATSVRGSEPTRWWTKAVERWPAILARVNAGG